MLIFLEREKDVDATTEDNRDLDAFAFAADDDAGAPPTARDECIANISLVFSRVRREE